MYLGASTAKWLFPQEEAAFKALCQATHTLVSLLPSLSTAVRRLFFARFFHYSASRLPQSVSAFSGSTGSCHCGSASHASAWLRSGPCSNASFASASFSARSLSISALFLSPALVRPIRCSTIVDVRDPITLCASSPRRFSLHVPDSEFSAFVGPPVPRFDAFFFPDTALLVSPAPPLVPGPTLFCSVAFLPFVIRSPTLFQLFANVPRLLGIRDCGISLVESSLFQVPHKVCLRVLARFVIAKSPIQLSNASSISLNALSLRNPAE